MKHFSLGRLLEHPETCLFHFFKRGVVIVKDSNQSDWLYIVKSVSVTPTTLNCTFVYVSIIHTYCMDSLKQHFGDKVHLFVEFFFWYLVKPCQHISPYRAVFYQFLYYSQWSKVIMLSLCAQGSCQVMKQLRGVRASHGQESATDSERGGGGGGTRLPRIGGLEPLQPRTDTGRKKNTPRRHVDAGVKQAIAQYDNYMTQVNVNA